MSRPRTAIIVGAGPNGLAAAIELARAGRDVTVLEATDEIGGGARTAELTLPGFRHDVCSTIHALGPSSPFLSTLGLERYGVQWLRPDVPLAVPLDDGRTALLHRSVERTAAELPHTDAEAYRRLLSPLVDDAERVWRAFLGPLQGAFRHPLVAARFGVRGLWSASTLAKARFRDDAARLLLLSCSAHSFLDLREPATAALGLMLMLSAHTDGWPVARGGSQALIDGMAAMLRDLGGRIETGRAVRTLDELPKDAAVIFDLTPRQILAITGDALPVGYRKRLGRYRYGAAAFKVDWALDGPIPWRDSAVGQAGTVHLGGQPGAMEASEAAVARGHVSDRPFVLLTQPTVIDPDRAPAGRHIAWAYCHVPPGWPHDMTDTIEREIERFAPGFRDRIIGRATMGPAAFARYNQNYVEGDINGGRQHLAQQFFRPVARWDPYATPNQRLFIGSSSTPPGGGIHGMPGYHAARSALSGWLR
ncbi:MAG TPA: NAD(P)/FAD-dependent oxidoreductase [Thermomicrobiales bacterium]|nr:NAD(P)/FAD-dependent oxidoreductase [Thermomicrobiales bacterium]